MSRQPLIKQQSNIFFFSNEYNMESIIQLILWIVECLLLNPNWVFEMIRFTLIDWDIQFKNNISDNLKKGRRLIGQYEDGIFGSLFGFRIKIIIVIFYSTGKYENLKIKFRIWVRWIRLFLIIDEQF